MMDLKNNSSSMDSVRVDLRSAYMRLRKLIVRKLMIIVPAEELDLSPTTIESLIIKNASTAYFVISVGEVRDLNEREAETLLLLGNEQWTVENLGRARCCLDFFEGFIKRYSGNCEFFSRTLPSLLGY